MFCTSCGTENPDDVRFCIQCGFGLSPTAPTEAFDESANEWGMLQSPPEAHLEPYHEPTMLQPPPPPVAAEPYREPTMFQSPPPAEPADPHRTPTMFQPPPQSPAADPYHAPTMMQPPPESKGELRGEATMMQSALDLPAAPSAPAIKPLPPASLPKRSKTPRYTHRSGDRVGVYTLQEPMGVGGFAEVWKALETTADREVALKIFYDRVMQDPTQARMFRMEAQKQARLEHERVTPIYYCHLDPQNGPPPYYIAMKLMTGGTLEDVLQARKQIPPQEALSIIRDVVEGLDVAHGAGIIHRDIKPRNVLFDKHGRATLADFGIAKDLKAASQTIAGTVMGTPQYMSPEQAMGLTITQAADIYSVGVMFYEMLAGRPPYTGKSVTEILLAHQRGNPTKLSELIPRISPALEEIVDTCLQPEGEHRYSDCKSLLHELDGIRETVAAGASTSDGKSTLPPARRPQTSRPSTPTAGPGTHAVVPPSLPAESHLGRNIAILIVALTLLAIAVGGWWLVSRRKAAPAAKTASHWIFTADCRSLFPASNNLHH